MEINALQMPVKLGDVLAGKYRVERVLGQGGMGVVVAARHLELGELYAIKFLLPETLTIPDAVERFLREARASARLKGEHVAKVHDVGRLESGSPYMVLEFLAGSDLHQLVSKRGPLPVEEVATYVFQACEAIAEAHSLGIIHRDIKPANLFLIQRPNGAPCIKVLDFGISKQITAENVDLTKTGLVVGSPLYMAPEQMFRTKSVDARSDVWSMGVVLYKLLTGTVPFLADTQMEVAARVLQEPHVPPSHLRPGLPVEIDAIVARCLQKRPEDRFQSINELASALHPFIAMGGPHAPVARAPYPSYVNMSQPELAPGTISQPETGSRVVTESGTAILAASNTTSAFGKTASGSNSKNGLGKVLAAAIGVIVVGGLGVWFALRSSPTATAPSQSSEVASVAQGAPAVQKTAAPPVVIAMASVTVEAPTTSASTAMANAPADASSRPGIPTSAVVAPPPSSNPVAKPPLPSPPSAPTTPKKSKHEGVF